MKELVKIVIDTKGGDKGAEAMLKGAAMALEKFPQLGVVLAGDREKIETFCREGNLPAERVEILDAPGEVTNYDHPADAIFHKQDASMFRALEALARREDLVGMLSCGNTGILLTAAMRTLSGPTRVRPAMAAVLPAEKGGFTCLVDTGATVDCNAAMLVHFAHLGAKLMHEMYGIPAPRIGLLSNGAEPTKGNALVKETHGLLTADGTLNFVGNIEGSNALSGDCDVLVCDGFAGNQVLKVTEGTARRIITDVMKYAHKTGSAEIRALGGHLMGLYDIGSLGGGIILGVEKPVIKARGSADEKAVVSVAEMLLNMASNKAMYDESRATL